MTKAALTPDDPPALPGLTPHEPSGRVRLFQSLHARIPPCRSSEPLLAAPAPPSLSRPALIEGLRQRIRAIERPRLQPAGLEEPGIAGVRSPAGKTGSRTWDLGAPEADGRLSVHGLDAAACHEVKPGSGTAGARTAALFFALALARRRLQAHAPARSPGAKVAPQILWCASPRTLAETGELHVAGLSRFGLPAPAFLMADARRDCDVLWVLEEALRSGSLKLVIGCLDDLKLTPARRLSLAAKEGGTPALLLTPAGRPPAGAMATRWRIEPAPSAPHPFDPRAPGRPRLAVRLERCRSAPAADESSFLMEWSDETHRFRMAAPLADRAPQAAHPWRCTG